MTRSVIQKFLENIKIKVTTIVTIPENNWVNPSKIPSDKISVSAMIRLTISPNCDGPDKTGATAEYDGLPGNGYPVQYDKSYDY